MEEILASIRRIISEDDQPAEAAAPAVAVSEPKPEPEVAPAVPASEPEPALAPVMAEPEDEPEPMADEEDDILELTDTVESHGDLAVVSPPALAPAPAPEPAAIEALVSDHAATAAASSFGALSAAIAMPKGDRTLEDVVRELLRPLLQQWLDANLPGIVQQAVETEVERIARGRVR